MRVTRDGAVTAVLVVALVAWVAIVVRAWDTWVEMNHATGTVAVLADAALHGEAAGHEGASEYLGALYAPPYPLFVAALKRAGLSWLHALRSGSVVSALLLLAAAAWAARAAGASPAGVRVTLALIAACNLFKVASLGGRADLLAAGCSVLAVGAWLRDRELKGWTCAAFAAAGWLCKVSEVTTPLAVLCMGALARDARPAVRFALRFAVVALAGVALMLPLHSLSWYASAFSTTLFAPPNLSNKLRGPAEVLRYIGSFAELALVAVMAVSALLEPALRRSPLRSSTAVALTVAMAVLAEDPLVLLAAGRRSPITDPATLRSRARAGDPRAQRIAVETAERHWALIVLETDATNEAWYRDFHFGDAVMQPLRAGYERAGDADGFALYRPRAAVPPAR